MSTVLPVQFQGVDEGADPKALAPGTLVVAENVVMDKSRRLVTRRGLDYLSPGEIGATSLLGGGASRLLSRGSDIAYTNGKDAYVYSPDATAWKGVGHTLDLRITKRGLVDTTRSADTADIAMYGNLMITVFLSGPIGSASNVLYYKVENVDTGAIVVPPTYIQTGCAWSRIRVFGSQAFIAWSQNVAPGSGGIVSAVRLDLSTFVLGSKTSLDAFNPVSDYPVLDMDIMTPTAGVPTLYLAYSLNGLGATPANRLRVSSWTLSTFETSAVLNTVDFATTSGNLNAINMACGADKVHVIFNLVAIGTDLLTTNATLGSAVMTYEGSYNKFVSVNIVDSTNLLVAMSGNDTASASPFKLTTYLTSIAAHTRVATTQRKTWQVVAHTKPWKVGTRWYTAATLAPKDNSLLVNTAIPNATGVILEIETVDSATSVQDSPLPHVGTTENLTAWLPILSGHISQTAAVGTTVYVPVPYRNREPLNFQNIPIGFDVYKVEIGGGDNHRLAISGRSGLAACGAPYWYDGTNVRRYGFVHAPMIIGLTAAGGGVMAAGVYGYVAVYEWKDGNGVLHRSIPSPPRQVTVTASQQVTIAVTTSAVSQKQGPPYLTNNIGAANPVLIALYRTEANGSVYHRLTLEPDYQVLINDPKVGSVSLIDTKADADIGGGSPARLLSTQPLLYTGASATGGELADVPPPSLTTVVTHGGRIAGLGPDGRTVWFTKDQTEDTTVAPSFNEVLTVAFSRDKTALASLATMLVVFGTDNIDLVNGVGPDASGAGAWDKIRIQTDIGCTNPRSIVTTPMGVAFQSARGLELLSTDYSVTWIGKTMEDTIAAYPVITSGVLCAADHEVRWTCNSVDGTKGLVLAWDYQNKIWIRRPYTDGGDTFAANIPFVDAALISGVYTLITARGLVYQESAAHHLDSGTWVTPTIKLAFLSPGGPGPSRGRVKDVTILGTPLTPYALEVSIARDYATTFEQVKTFAEGSVVTTAAATSKARVTLKNQKCQAVQIQLRALPPAAANYGTGAAVIFEGLMFRVQPKSGPVKTSSEEQG
jgi:hypothetical protein